MSRHPCKSCPWRVDQDARGIPNFSLELAEGLADTCGEPGNEVPFGRPMFACHQSKEGTEVVCAGWQAVYGHYHLGARIAASVGTISPDGFAPGEDWPELHTSFDQVIRKLRDTA